MPHSTQNRTFWRRFPKPIFWLGVDKTKPFGLVWKKPNLTQQKHTFTNQKKCITTQNRHKKLKPGLPVVAFYDIQPGNGAGLFSKEKISKGEDK